MKTLLYALGLLLPWPLRRIYLQAVFGFELHPTSRIGLAWVLPKKLVLREHSSIGNMTVCKHIDLVELGAHATIGRGNWITGFPSGPWKPFSHDRERHPELILGEHSAITNRHFIDCTSRVRLGAFTTFAGYQSQILTHAISIERSRQESAPVEIGDRCFVGTNCVLLGGSSLPSCSVLGAKSLLNKKYEETYTLYGGTPAKPLKKLDQDSLYFSRKQGAVD